MKKVVCSILAVMLLFAGCSIGKPPVIEKTNWQMDVIQNSSGKVISSGPKSSFECDKRLNLTAKAQNGLLTFKNNDKKEEYTFTYTETEVKQDSRIYSVIVGNDSGMAVVSNTKIDKKSIPTLYVNIDGYSFRFYKTY